MEASATYLSQTQPRFPCGADPQLRNSEPTREIADEFLDRAERAEPAAERPAAPDNQRGQRESPEHQARRIVEQERQSALAERGAHEPDQGDDRQLRLRIPADEDQREGEKRAAEDRKPHAARRSGASASPAPPSVRPARGARIATSTRRSRHMPRKPLALSSAAAASADRAVRRRETRSPWSTRFGRIWPFSRVARKTKSAGEAGSHPVNALMVSTLTSPRGMFGRREWLAPGEIAHFDRRVGLTQGAAARVRRRRRNPRRRSSPGRVEITSSAWRPSSLEIMPA